MLVGLRGFPLARGEEYGGGCSAGSSLFWVSFCRFCHVFLLLLLFLPDAAACQWLLLTTVLPLLLPLLVLLPPLLAVAAATALFLADAANCCY